MINDVWSHANGYDRAVDSYIYFFFFENMENVFLRHILFVKTELLLYV